MRLHPTIIIKCTLKHVKTMSCIKNFLYKIVEAVKAPTTLPAILSQAFTWATVNTEISPVVLLVLVKSPVLIKAG